MVWFLFANIRKMFRFLSVVWKLEMSGKQTWKRDKGRRNFALLQMVFTYAWMSSFIAHCEKSRAFVFSSISQLKVPK